MIIFDDQVFERRLIELGFDENNWVELVAQPRTSEYRPRLLSYINNN